MQVDIVHDNDDYNVQYIYIDLRYITIYIYYIQLTMDRLEEFYEENKVRVLIEMNENHWD